MFALSLSTPSQAGIIVFDNLGPGHTYDQGGGSLPGKVATLTGDQTLVMAVQFTATGGGALATIELPLSDFMVGSTVTLDVNLHEDAGGVIGALLSSGTAVTQGPYLGGVPGVFPLATAFMSAAPIVAGGAYWVVVGSPSLQPAVWHNSFLYVDQNQASSINGAPFSYFTSVLRPGIVVRVPEPSTSLLAALGAVVLFVKGRVTRRTNT